MCATSSGRINRRQRPAEMGDLTPTPLYCDGERAGTDCSHSERLKPHRSSLQSARPQHVHAFPPLRRTMASFLLLHSREKIIAPSIYGDRHHVTRELAR